MERSVAVELEQSSEIAKEETLISSEESDFKETVIDYFRGVSNWQIWNYMALADIRRRYRRTVIGPFWTTLSLAIFVTSMGLLFSVLWKIDIKSFLPYFASGFISWTFVSCIITEGCSTFITMEGLLKQVPLELSCCSMLVVVRNFWIFLHQIVIYIIIAFIFHVPFTSSTWLVLPAFFLLFFTGIWVSMLLGAFCARYRDVQQVVTSLLQISTFVTPIFWPEHQLGGSMKAYLLVNGNPLYHYVSLIRQPLLGNAPHLLSWIVVTLITFSGWLATLWIISKKRRQLVFWL